MGRKRNQNGSACDRSAESADRDQIGRYRVEIVIVSQGYNGPAHTFTSRVAAERFARAVSHYLPRTSDLYSNSPAWVLVYALPMPDAPAWARTPSGHCYMSLDGGESLVKRHAILPYHYGAKESRHAA